MKDEQRKQAQRAYQAYRRDANLLFKRHRSFKAQETAGSAGMVAQHLPLHQRGDNSVGVDLNIDVASSLDETEASVIKLMLDAVGLSKSETIVRIAGGWVRDKLLGLQNEDIDIALDNCTGVAFANLVNAFLKFSGQEEGKVAVIEANPDQSKHLQTARMKILGVWVDLVNLRTETYRSNCRIPEVSFGTAEEDAMRRDFTINALFYNCNTRSVEDMTGRGLDDLRDGVIHTPLSPMITFQDDPLRVLRAVRFASRFGFVLDKDLRTAARDSRIQAALESKVSRERVGAELCGMLTGKMAQPDLALSLLEELGLSQAVFAPPANLEPSAPRNGFDWAYGAAAARAAARVLEKRALSEMSAVDAADGGLDRNSAEYSTNEANGCAKDLMDDTGSSANVDPTVTSVDPGVEHTTAAGVDQIEVKGKEKGNSDANSTTGPEEKSNKSHKGGKGVKSDGVVTDKQDTLVRELFLSAALLPLAGVRHKFKKGKYVPAAQSVVQDSLKLKSKEAKNVGEVLEMLPTFQKLADTYTELTRKRGDVMKSCDGVADEQAQGVPSELCRLEVGLAVRQAKELWQTCLDLCCAAEICRSAGGPTVVSERTSANFAPIVQEDDDGNSQSGGKRARLQDGEKDECGTAQEERIMANYAGFAGAIRRMGLARAWSIPPLVGGHDVIGTLGVAKGPQVGVVMAKQVRWQLEHPEGTREQCIAYLSAEIAGGSKKSSDTSPP